MENNYKVAFYTLGCKVNQYETNALTTTFKEAGYQVVDFEDYADIYIINTCTVTGMSDKKSRQIIRRAKTINPNSIVCAIGCYAQVAKNELMQIEDIDIILGTKEKSNLLPKVQEILNNREERIVEVSDVMKNREYTEYKSIAYSKHVRAEVKIQDGCDRFCTYCIIPYARGPVRSRNKDEIINEIKELSIKDGIKEVVLTGIHISSYGKDLFKWPENISAEDRLYRDNHYIYDYGLIDLLEEINGIETINRIRLGSIEPRIFTKEFVERIKKLDKVCNHFHLSLQSGCDATLQRMNRKYTTEDFREIVKLIRENIKDVAITTDIIVGFPGETDEEFNESYDFLKEVNLSKMHVFKYSKRKGTPAESFKNQVPEDVKNDRSEALIALNNINEKAFAEKYLGKEIEVLFENELEGHTRNYIKIILNKSNKDVSNRIVYVKAIKFEDEALICEI